MEGPFAKPFCSGAAKPAMALVMGGVLLMGMSACGSDSKDAPSTTVAKKQAGVLSTRLDVVSKDPRGIAVGICGNGDRCKPEQKLAVDGTVDMAAAVITGSIRYADGDLVRFRAYNPTVGLPVIRMTGDPPEPSSTCKFSAPAGPGGNQPGQFNLGEGEEQEMLVSPAQRGSGTCSSLLKASRGPDVGDYKRLKLEVYEKPS